MKSTLTVPALARVEGEGGLYIGMTEGRVTEIRLDIYEPPRFFEGFLRGRFLQEVPDITARICGICPVAYQMSSVRALERALGIEVGPEVRALRRLLYCAEYIESHALHIYMLQAPDIVGVESALALAEIDPGLVGKALRLKKAGNELLRAIGGRSVHPVNACVGGFHRWPRAAEIRALVPELTWGLQAAIETARWAGTLPFPDLEVDYECVALSHPDEYAILEGDVISSKGPRIPVERFDEIYLETHVRHSNALHSLTADGRPYLVGPIARMNLNHDRLGAAAAKALAEMGLVLPIRNPYRGLQARAVELVEAFDEALALARDYAPAGPSRAEFDPRPGEGCAATEAPRGLLYHRYAIDREGLVTSARIVPPTAQNLARIEADLWAIAPRVVEMPEEKASLICEHLVRSYDPCISCATHFLKLRIDRG